MSKIFVHALAATAGGGVTYLRNLLAQIHEHGSDDEWLVLAPAETSVPLVDAPHLRMAPHQATGSLWRRILFDQHRLRRFLIDENVDLILATGNFGLLWPPVPQLLLSRNALYFSAIHIRQLIRRGKLWELANIMLRQRWAMASIKASALTVVPSFAMAREVRDRLPRLSAHDLRIIAHGFDHESFVRPLAELPAPLQAQLDSRSRTRRILMVSHYNYSRNFETLLRAIALLRARVADPIELLLTTRLGPRVKDHRYDTTVAHRLLTELDLGDCVRMLGTVAHNDLYALYRQAEIVVCPSYSESFGHPMVEAMASGRPLVVSDLPVHREICGPAAAYFRVFDPVDLAERIHQLLVNRPLATVLARFGKQRAQQFSWQEHFRCLQQVIHEIIEQGPSCAEETQAA